MSEQTVSEGTPGQGAEGETHSLPHVIELTEKLSIPVVDKAGNSKGTIEFDPADFGGKISRQLMHDVVLMYLANQRAGTHHTLRRGQVAGSTKKLFRQKGTGNARAGTKRTNKRRGGGTAKGPKPRDYEYHLPKKAVRAATRMAILSKFMDKEVVILDELSLAAPKTKEIVGLLKAVKIGKKMTDAGEKDVSLHDTTVLIGTDKLDVNVFKSARNIEGVKVLPAAEFNCYTVLKHKRLVLTQAALEALRKPSAEKAEPAKAAPPEESKVRYGRAGEIQKRKKTGKPVAAK
jgi:large subunit ribosomal protein L4